MLACGESPGPDQPMAVRPVLDRTTGKGSEAILGCPDMENIGLLVCWGGSEAVAPVTHSRQRREQ